MGQGQVLSPPASLQLSMAVPDPVTGSWHLGVESLHVALGAQPRDPPNGIGTVLIMRTSFPGAQGVSRNGQVGCQGKETVQVHRAMHTVF